MILKYLQGFPTTDNECTNMGWEEYTITTPDGSLNMHVSVAPDADRDAVVHVFNHDEQAMFEVWGWAWMWERIGG